MKAIVAILAFVAMVFCAGNVQADWLDGFSTTCIGCDSIVPTTTTPLYSTSYDYNSGNFYDVDTYSDRTEVRGHNFNTGSMWSGTYNDDGTSYGTDKDYNHWTYDSNSTVYTNTNGTMCFGTGALRSCF